MRKLALGLFTSLVAIGFALSQSATMRNIPVPASSSSAPHELASYNCSPVENPISDSGNITALGFTNTPQAIASNICEPIATNTNYAGFFTGYTPWPDNQYSEVTVWSLGGGTNSYLPVMVRKANSTAITTYYLQLQGFSSWTVYAIITGTSHSIGTITAGGGGVVPGTVVRFSVQTGSGNNVLHVYNNGAEMTGSPITDSTYYASLTSGIPGFATYCTGGIAITNCQISKWAGGSL